MKRNYPLMLFFSIFMLLIFAGCAPKIYEVKLFTDKKIDTTATVAVVPLTGTGYYRSSVSEWLTHQLRKRTSNTIISPAMVEKNLADHNVSLVFKYKDGNVSLPDAHLIHSKQNIEYIEVEDEKIEYQTYAFSKKELIDMGSMSDVDFVISGSVASINSVDPLPFRQRHMVDLQIIDVKQQSVIGVFHSNTSLSDYKATLTNDWILTTNHPNLENMVADIVQLLFVQTKATQ